MGFGRYSTLLKNLGLITVGKVATKIVAVLILPFYTTYLSPEDYGGIDLVVAYCGLFLQPVTLCIDSAIFIFPNGKVDFKKRKYFSSGFFLSFVPLCLFFVAMYLMTRYSAAWPVTSFVGTLTRNSLLLCLLVAVGFLSDFLQQMLRTLNKIGLYAIIGIANSLSMILFAVVLLPKFGAKGYMYSLVLSSLLVSLVMFFSCGLWKWLSIKCISWRYYIQMLRYSLPLIPAPALLWVQTQSNRPILASYWGMAAVGIYGFAIRFPSMISLFADSLCKSWEISALNEYRKEGFSSFYNNVCLVFVAVGGMLCVVFAIGVEPIFRLLINDRFHSALRYVPMATASMFFAVCGQLLGVNLTVRKESYKFLWSSLIAVAVAASGNLILIPIWGLWGACITMLAATFAVMVARYFMANRMFRLVAIRRIMAGILIVLGWMTICSAKPDLVVRVGASLVAFVLLPCCFYSQMKGLFKWRLK